MLLWQHEGEQNHRSRYRRQRQREGAATAAPASDSSSDERYALAVQARSVVRGRHTCRQKRSCRVRSPAPRQQPSTRNTPFAEQIFEGDRRGEGGLSPDVSSRVEIQRRDADARDAPCPFHDFKPLFCWRSFAVNNQQWAVGMAGKGTTENQR